MRLPVTPGHEFSGQVIKLGPDADKHHKVNITKIFEFWRQKWNFLDRYRLVIWSFPSKLSLAINADFAKLGNTKYVQTTAFMGFIVKPTEPWQNL